MCLSLSVVWLLPGCALLVSKLADALVHSFARSSHSLPPPFRLPSPRCGRTV